MFIDKIFIDDSSGDMGGKIGRKAMPICNLEVQPGSTRCTHCNRWLKKRYQYRKVIAIKIFIMNPPRTFRSKLTIQNKPRSTSIIIEKIQNSSFGIQVITTQSSLWTLKSTQYERDVRTGYYHGITLHMEGDIDRDWWRNMAEPFRRPSPGWSCRKTV